jgi:hypothetical protein
MHMVHEKVTALAVKADIKILSRFRFKSLNKLKNKCLILRRMFH